VAARDEAGERAREIVGRGLPHEGPAAGSSLDDPEKLECPQRFANRSARDLELLGELPLGRKLVPGAEIALFQEALDLLDDALIKAAAADRLDDGQGLTSPKSLWSGGQTRCKGAAYGCLSQPSTPVASVGSAPPAGCAR
jgi:hypothetical protein